MNTKDEHDPCKLSGGENMKLSHSLFFVSGLLVAFLSGIISAPPRELYPNCYIDGKRIAGANDTLNTMGFDAPLPERKP